MLVPSARRFTALWISSAAALCLLLSSCPKASPFEEGPSYYVSPSGDDAGPGSFASPWKSLSKAGAAAVAGDRVLIRAGTYNERFVIMNSGEAGKPIVFTAYPGETPEIDGTGVAIPNNWGALVEAVDRDHIRISGLTVRNSAFGDIWAMDGSDIQITGNRVSDSYSSGIMAWNDADLLIEGNVVLRTNRGEEGSQECISVSSATGFTLRSNEVAYGFMEGIDAKVSCTNGTIADNYVHDLPRLGIYVDAWDGAISGVQVSGNTVARCGEGIRVNAENGGSVRDCAVKGNELIDNKEAGVWLGVGGAAAATHTLSGITVDGNLTRGNGDGIRVSVPAKGTTEDITISNNVVLRNERSGVHIADYSSGTGSMKNISIVNNTIDSNGTNADGGSDWGDGGIFQIAASAQAVVIRNNIVSNNRVFSIVLGDGVAAAGQTAIDHNLFYGFRDFSGETRGLGPVEGDPLFQNPDAGMSLRAGSPAIDAGSAESAPTQDFTGRARPQGAGIDIGAFEQ